MFVRPMTLTLMAILAGAAIFLPLVPEPYRAANIALFGALGLFVAARVGLWQALVVTIIAKLVSDLIGYAAHHYNPDYLPMWEVLLSFAVYPLCGRLLQRTQNPLAMVGTALLASVAFFLITNFGSWLRQALPYPVTPGGLLTCYAEGLPFYRATLTSDLVSTMAVLGVHTLLCNIYFPKEQAIPAVLTVQERN
jgi:hypothetical protein